VPFVVDGAERRLDELPTPFVLERRAHGVHDEAATTSRTDPPIEISNHVVWERYV
jgi:hypothetical protein